METMDKTKEEEVDGSISDEEEHVGATNLPSCVIQRVLSGTKKDLKANLEWLCTNIFHTHMEHGDRALNIIIDDGSTMNVIFETAVERLVLKIEKHPTPCQISWVNEDNSVLVKDRCLVRFLLGKTYMDEAQCDVIPMTIRHMLLGRSWLYDRSVFYDGYAKIYSFTFKGKKLVLDPLQILEIEKQKDNAPVLTMRQFTRA